MILTFSQFAVGHTCIVPTVLGSYLIIKLGHWSLTFYLSIYERKTKSLAPTKKYTNLLTMLYCANETIGIESCVLVTS